MVVAGKCVRLGLALMIVASTFGGAGSQPVEAASVKALTMREAVDQGLKISPQLRDVKMDILKKKMELEQAQHAVKSEEAKASGLFAKPRNLSQDLTTRMKVPEARKQLYMAQETLRQTMTTVKFDVEKAYLQAFQDAASEEIARKKWEAAKKGVDTAKLKRSYGLADPAEQEDAAKALEKTVSEYKQAQLTAKGSRLALGQTLKLEMENKLQLSFEPDYGDLNQKQLPSYIVSALKTTPSLLQDTEDRRLADQKLNAARDLYSSKFGAARMKVMDGMYKAQDIDMELFTANYETTLSRVKQDWEGYFMLLGIIPIPKSLLQGEYDGLRYLDDLRDALPITTMEQNKAVLKEKESRNGVIAAVRQSYLEAKGTEEGYAQALRNKENAVTDLDKATMKQKLGLMKTDELQAFKEAVAKADQQILMAQMTYKTALGKLNVDTGGAVEKTLKPGILPLSQIDDGLAAVKPQKPKASIGTWNLKPAVGPLLSDFTIKVGKKLGATDYAVFTKEGKPVGKRAKLNKPVRYLTLLFSKSDDLKVVLYKKDTSIGELVLEGAGNSGQLAAGTADGSGPSTDGKGNNANSSGEGASASSGGGTVIIGSYKIQLDALTPAAYNAAAATMAKSGQGIFMQAGEPGAVWFGMDNAVDPSTITDASSPAALSKAAAAALKVTVEIAKPGAIASLETPAQLQQDIDTLKKDIAKLEAAKDAAVSGAKLAEVADLVVQLKDAQAQLGMAEALLKGDSAAALEQMALVNNPDAIIASLSEESGSPPAGSGGGGTNGGSSEPAAGAKASEDQLAEGAELQRQKLEQAIAAGDATAAAAQLQSLLATQAQLADVQNGTSEGLASLGEAKRKLQAALEQAQQDPERVETLTRSIAAVDEAKLETAKAGLFAQLDAARELLATLPPGAGVHEKVQQQVSKLLEQLGQQEKAKYTPEELQALADQAAALDLPPILAENVLSPDFFIKFDAPPVIINGNAYLPIRPVSESFGAAVDWEEDNATVTVSTDVATVMCSIDNPTAYVDGEPMQIETPPLLLGGRTYVPLRFISESLGLQVDWNAPTQTIQISN
ncbi:stalk domain-containing protein [Paenibacillus sp. SI8]|uniref:stalk domain-containing protein n=1 Tax=unclassified Paenibacillus TaxID=185978 RepID=UPI0034651497